MKARYIYELSVIPIGTLNTIRKKEPHYAYFSNLKKTVECLTAVLAMNGWPVTINYSSVYRSMQTRGKFNKDFEIGGNKVFKVLISTKELNPALTTLGIEEMPYPKMKGSSSKK
jgi:hypothetical protein